MADDTIRIDELDPTATPSREHLVPAMKDGLTVFLSVEQIMSLIAAEDIEAGLAAGGEDDTFPETGELLFLLGSDLKRGDLLSFFNKMKWRSKGIGEYYFVNSALTGADLPPSSTTDTAWIELTAGLTGAGAFNAGKLTSESVSGSAPLVLASAVISLAGSPMNGQTVRLLNTEGRIIRPSTSPGTLQDDQLQGFRIRIPRASSTTSVGASAGSSPNGTFNDVLPADDGTNGTPRVGLETRMKNLGVKAFMRIK